MPYAQTFVIVYSHTYSTQSRNIALLSCLLRTLGIVLYCILNIHSCLLRTLAVWYCVLASRNLAVTFCTLSHMCLVTGYAVIIAGGAVSWSSRLQPVVSLSTTEAEYIAAVEAGKEIIWMRNLLTEFGFPITSPSPLLIDNNSAVTVAKNPEHHGRMKI